MLEVAMLDRRCVDDVSQLVLRKDGIEFVVTGIRRQLCLQRQILPQELKTPFVR